MNRSSLYLSLFSVIWFTIGFIILTFAVIFNFLEHIWTFLPFLFFGLLMYISSFWVSDNFDKNIELEKD